MMTVTIPTKGIAAKRKSREVVVCLWFGDGAEEDFADDEEEEDSDLEIGFLLLLLDGG